jgi:hypothetical protein
VNFVVRVHLIILQLQIIPLTKNMRLESGSQDYARMLDLIGRADPLIQDGQ